MAKIDRKNRKQARRQKHNIARTQRAARKSIRQQGKTDRKQNRQDAKTERQDLRHQGRADNLKTRILNRATQIKASRQALDREVNEQASNSGQSPQEVYRRKIDTPETKAQMREYIAQQGGGELPEDTDLDSLIGSTLLDRGEEIGDLREPIAEEIESEGDEVFEEFENFELFETAAFLNEEEYPENFESMTGVISPTTWATISGATKGGLEVIAKKRFAQGKKFLGKSEKEWTAPTDPNAPSEIIYKEVEEKQKGNFIQENLTGVIITVVVITLLLVFAFRGAKNS